MMVGFPAMSSSRQQHLDGARRIGERGNREYRRPVWGGGIGIGAAGEHGFKQRSRVAGGGHRNVRPIGVQILMRARRTQNRRERVSWRHVAVQSDGATGPQARSNGGSTGTRGFGEIER